MIAFLCADKELSVSRVKFAEKVTNGILATREKEKEKEDKEKSRD
jgi:hypothetical protein